MAPEGTAEPGDPDPATPRSWAGPGRTRSRSLAGGAGPAPAGPAGTTPAGPAGRRPATTTRDAGARRPGAARTDDALRELVVGFARAFLEVESGRRPRRQLRPVMSVELASRLAPRWVREGLPPGRVVRVSGTRTAPGRYEAVAIVARGDRYGALAVSLARRRGAWLVVEALRPELTETREPPAREG